MVEGLLFPWRLDNVLFKSLHFSRIPALPEPLELGVQAEIKVLEERFPDALQIEVKLETPEEQPVMLCLELVGLFSIVDELPEPDRGLIAEFVNERALHMMMPYMIQMVRFVTGQMGMSPINIPIPYAFNYPQSEEAMEPGENREAVE